MDNNNGKQLGNKLASLFAIAIWACITALSIAVTIKLILWIL